MSVFKISKRLGRKKGESECYVFSTLLCLTVFLISSIVFGDTVPIGYVSWDVTSPGSTGEI